MARVRIKDGPWRAIKKSLLSIPKGHVIVGVLSDARRGPGEMTTIALANEFGTRDGRIPERSFIRSTFDEQRRALRALQRRLFAQVLLRRMTSDQALTALGLFMQGKIQRKITDLKAPPNAPSTIAQKGSSNPLIDTGQLRQAITFKVRKTKRPRGGI